MRRFFLCLLLIVSTSVYADPFKCKAEFSKGSCWDSFDVTAYLEVPSMEGKKTEIVLGKNVFNLTKEFPCRPNELLAVEVEFSPPIWADDEGKLYKAEKKWLIPDSIPEKSDYFLINICFPGNFPGSPIPIKENIKSCECTFTNLDDQASDNKSQSSDQDQKD